MLFAGVLPEILELLGQRSKWMGSYTSVKGKRWLLFLFDENLVYSLLQAHCRLWKYHF